MTQARWCPRCRGKLQVRVRTITRVGKKPSVAVNRYLVCEPCHIVVRVQRWSDKLRVPVVTQVVQTKYE